MLIPFWLSQGPFWQSLSPFCPLFLSKTQAAVDASCPSLVPLPALPLRQLLWFKIAIIIDECGSYLEGSFGFKFAFTKINTSLMSLHHQIHLRSSKLMLTFFTGTLFPVPVCDNKQGYKNNFRTHWPHAFFRRMLQRINNDYIGSNLKKETVFFSNCQNQKRQYKKRLDLQKNWNLDFEIH